VFLNTYFQRSASFADITSAAVAWDTVHRLLRLLGISNRSSFHQCPTECRFSFENGSEVETVPNASEFLGSALYIRDDHSALLYCV
jgi:hypothetical protein